MTETAEHDPRGAINTAVSMMALALGAGKVDKVRRIIRGLDPRVRAGVVLRLAQLAEQTARAGAGTRHIDAEGQGLPTSRTAPVDELGPEAAGADTAGNRAGWLALSMLCDRLASGQRKQAAESMRAMTFEARISVMVKAGMLYRALSAPETANVVCPCCGKLDSEG